MTDKKDVTENRLSSTPPPVLAARVVLGSKVVSAEGAAICVVEYSLSTAARKALNVGSADKLDLK